MIETTVKYDSETFDSHTDTTVKLAYSAEDIRRELASESQATVMFVLRRQCGPGPTAQAAGCGPDVSVTVPSPQLLMASGRLTYVRTLLLYRFTAKCFS